MTKRSLSKQLEEIHVILNQLSERVHDLERPPSQGLVKPCNHFGDLITALEAIKRVADVCQQSHQPPTSKELSAINRIASAALEAKGRSCCPRWKLHFDPDVT